MTTTEPPEPSPRSDSEEAVASDSPAPERSGGAAPDDELSPEELQRRQERKEARKAARREARRVERNAQRRAEREAAREAEWDRALAKAESSGTREGSSREGDRGTSPSGREPLQVFESTGRGFPRMRHYQHQLRKRRGLVWHLARSQMKGENYNTFFGQLWLILNPLMLAGVYVLGRSVIRPMGSPAERNFLIAHLVAGVFLFQFTAKSMNQGSRSIVANKNMLLNTSFPRLVFPLATVVRSVFDLVPLMLTLFVVRIFLDQPTTWVYVFLPFVIAIQLIFNMGLIFGTAALVVMFRDVSNVLNFTSRLWLWMTPVLYTTAEIPESIRWLLQLNPLYPMFAMYEEIWVGKVPSPGLALWALAWAVPVFIAGLVLFLWKERDFAVRL